VDYKYQVAISYATEEQALAEKVYHYLRAEDVTTFFAPAPECQAFLSGMNQREAFYRIFGLYCEYAVLLVCKNYVVKPVPMEEANIAFSKRGPEGKVIPVYLDGTSLPQDMLDPKVVNYFSSNNPVEIAGHIAAKINNGFQQLKSRPVPAASNVINATNNKGKTQYFINM
jgi:hypothetical protein